MEGIEGKLGMADMGLEGHPRMEMGSERDNAVAADNSHRDSYSSGTWGSQAGSAAVRTASCFGSHHIACPARPADDVHSSCRRGSESSLTCREVKRSQSRDVGCQGLWDGARIQVIDDNGTREYLIALWEASNAPGAGMGGRWRREQRRLKSRDLFDVWIILEDCGPKCVVGLTGPP